LESGLRLSDLRRVAEQHVGDGMIVIPTGKGCGARRGSSPRLRPLRPWQEPHMLWLRAPGGHAGARNHAREIRIDLTEIRQ
jgi:hypothetical protein